MDELWYAFCHLKLDRASTKYQILKKIVLFFQNPCTHDRWIDYALISKLFVINNLSDLSLHDTEANIISSFQLLSSKHIITEILIDSTSLLSTNQYGIYNVKINKKLNGKSRRSNAVYVSSKKHLQPEIPEQKRKRRNTDIIILPHRKNSKDDK